MFSVTPDSVEYKVQRWNQLEIVASTIVGICRMNNTLKFDRKNKKVYWLATLSEPVDNLPKMSQNICNSAGQQRLELHGETMYKDSAKK